MDKPSEKLFQKNYNLFFNAGGDRAKHLDLELVKKLRDLDSKAKSEWLPSDSNTLLFPRILPNSDAGADSLLSQANKYKIGDNIEQYLNIAGDDPHTLTNLASLREFVISTGFDPNIQHTTIQGLFSPAFCLCVGTGDGRQIMHIVNKYNVQHLIVAVPKWEYFASSFWYADWKKINSRFEVSGKKITLGCYDSGDYLLALMAEESFVGIDHSLLFCPSSPDREITKITDAFQPKKIANIINYTGFAIDEYNMLVNSSRFLSSQPKVFDKPLTPLKVNAVVCGSGPSLDSNLDVVSRLSESHLIIASGSNLRTLLKNKIRVDVLCIMERNMNWELYKQTLDDYGSTNTRLFASVTCPYEFHNIFPDACIFFRPALTPLSVFSNNSREILNHEGPQSINSGASFASSIGCHSILLVGVDLGTADQNCTRSKDASGIDDRVYDQPVPGNLRETVFTSKRLIDSKLQLEAMVKNSDSNFYNLSDGVKFTGVEAVDEATYNCFIESKQSSGLDVFYDWWSSQRRYNQNRFLSSWKSRNPRRMINRFFDKLHNLCAINHDSDKFESSFLPLLTDLLSISNKSYAEQFPVRLSRACLLKTFYALHRQLVVMGDSKSQKDKLVTLFLQHFNEFLIDLEAEQYQLCDHVELMFSTRSSKTSLAKNNGR